jgi:hypothetical protein
MASIEGSATAEVPLDGTGLSTIRILSSIALIQYPGIVKQDPYLEPFSDALRRRFNKTQEWIKTINNTEGGMEHYTKVSVSFKHRIGVIVSLRLILSSGVR